MGRKVNVVLPGGRVVSVDEELAGKAQLPTASTEAEADIAKQQLVEERTSGFGQGAAAFGEGLADAVSGGAYGWAAGNIDPAYGEEMAERGEERAGARFAGTALGVLAPTGLLGGAAKSASALTFAGRALRAGEAIGGLKGVATEGAILGLGGYVAESNVTGDRLTIEGAALSAGLGGLVDVGIVGGLGRVAKRGMKAQGVLDDIAKSEVDADLVRKNKKLFEDSPAYNEVREASDGLLAHIKEQNKEIRQELNEYAAALDPGWVKKRVEDYRKVHHEILSDINATPYGRQVNAAARKQRAAIKKYEEQTQKFEKWANDTGGDNGLPATLSKFQKAIDDVADRYGLGPNAKKKAEAEARRAAKSKAAPTELENQLQATNEALASGVSMEEMEAARAIEADFLANGPTPEPTGIEAELAGYREKLSRASKLVAGGYDTEAKRWVAAAGEAPSDIRAALQDLHDLRESLKKYTHIKKPNLPDIPVRPEDWQLPTPEVDVTDAQQLSTAAVDLDKSIERAREFSKGGDYGAAIAELRAAEGRVRSIPGMGDLAFPKLPPPPRPLKDVPDVALPKTLREFGRKTPEKIAQWNEFLTKHDNGSVADGLNRLGEELGLGPTTGLDLHGKMKPTLDALDRLAAKVAKDETGPKTFLGATKDFAKNAFSNGLGFWAFGAAGGGVPGAVMGSLARTSVRRSMSEVDGTLIAAKDTLRKGIATVVAKIGRTAEKGKKLAPIGAYLSNTFLFGEKDDGGGSVRDLADRRITEIAQHSINAPDAAFMTLEPLLGHPGDIGGKLHDWTRNAFAHLTQVMPKDPGLDITPTGSNWRPSHQQAIELAHRIEAVTNPLDAVERTIRGEGHPAAADTLWTVYPAMMGELAAQYSAAAAEMQMTYEQGSYVSQLFRVPMTGLQQPLVATALQGLYLPSPQQPQQGQQSGPGGRPARVQSEVAGSSVAGLIS